MRGLYEKLVNRDEKISLIGSGYVGMPIAVTFAQKLDVIEFDVNKEKVLLYKQGIDPTKEVGDEIIKHTTVDFTYDESRLKEAKFHIMNVPIPVRDDNPPDWFPVEAASRILGTNLTKGSIVVYESTVFLGVIEEICVSIFRRDIWFKVW